MSKVITFVNGRERIMFEGLEDDARRYLTQRFPRLHIEPGSGMDPVPDAVVETDEGKREFHNGAEWAEHVPESSQGTRTAPDGRDARIAELEAQLAARGPDAPPSVDLNDPAPVEPVDATVPEQ